MGAMNCTPTSFIQTPFATPPKKIPHIPWKTVPSLERSWNAGGTAISYIGDKKSGTPNQEMKQAGT
jgi:hypothetical protein